MDDRLYFADFDEFSTFYLELDSLLSYDADLFDSIVLADSPVQTINDLMYTDEYVSDPFETFMADPVMRAIVNPYHEFQIDDVLVTWINNGEILTSDASNSSLRASLRAITKGEPLDIGDIPEGAYWSTPKELEDAVFLLCGCRVYIEPLCPDEIRVHGFCRSFFGGDGTGNVTVGFNPDGSLITNPILDEDVDGNFEFFINVSVFNGQDGLVIVEADPNCLTGNTQRKEWSYDFSEYAVCDEQERNIVEIITQGNERMRVETAFYENWLAYYHKAEIISENWNGSKWVKSKSNLRASVEADRRGLFCNFLDSKDETKSCDNCQRKYAKVSWTSLTAHCDDDLIGTFRKIEGSTTMERTQNVDFVCCQ